MPKAKDILNKKSKKGLLSNNQSLPKSVLSRSKNLERRIDTWLDEPMDKAYDAGEAVSKEGEDPVDNFRHPMAGMYTSEAIQNKTGNIPIVSNALGYIGSNYLGAGHELSTLFRDKRSLPVKLREAGEDIFNNGVGAFMGSLPLDSQTKANTLYNLSQNNQLPDGYGDANMYFKKEEFKNGGKPNKKKLKYNKKGTYPTYEFPPAMATGGWLDQYTNGGNLNGVVPPPIYVDPNDPVGMQRYQAYNDSLKVYNSSKFIKEHPLTGNYMPGKEDKKQVDININKQNVDKYRPKLSTTYTGYYYDYKKPVQPYELVKRTPYSPVTINKLNTQPIPLVNQQPIKNLPETVYGELPDYSSEPYWTKNQNTITLRNNPYSKPEEYNITLPPEGYNVRFGQEPSVLIGNERYRLGPNNEAYLVPGDWKTEQQVVPTENKGWKQVIKRKQNGGWLDNL